MVPLSLSHLFFADDVLLFSRVDASSLNAIKRTLDSFLNSSGLVINQHKSSIWFSNNTPPSARSLAENILGFKFALNLGSYLGFPLGINKRVADFNSIVQKVCSKIDSWKSKNLSLPGKVNLIKSFCAPIAAYYMQCLSFPKSTCNAIDKTLRNFLWSDGVGKNTCI